MPINRYYVNCDTETERRGSALTSVFPFFVVQPVQPLRIPRWSLCPRDSRELGTFSTSSSTKIGIHPKRKG